MNTADLITATDALIAAAKLADTPATDDQCEMIAKAMLVRGIPATKIATAVAASGDPLSADRAAKLIERCY